MIGRNLRALLDGLFPVGPVETLGQKMIRETNLDLTIALAQDRGGRSPWNTVWRTRQNDQGDHGSTAA